MKVGAIMFSDFSNIIHLSFGVNGDLPYIDFYYGNDFYNLLDFLKNDTVFSLVQWFKAILGIILLASTIIGIITQFSLIINGKFTWVKSRGIWNLSDNLNDM